MSNIKVPLNKDLIKVLNTDGDTGSYSIQAPIDKLDAAKFLVAEEEGTRVYNPRPIYNKATPPEVIFEKGWYEVANVGTTANPVYGWRLVQEVDGMGIEQVTVMPEPSEEYNHKLVQYVGTDAMDEWSTNAIYCCEPDSTGAFHWYEKMAKGDPAIKKMYTLQNPNEEGDIMLWLGEDDESKKLYKNNMYIAKKNPSNVLDWYLYTSIGIIEQVDSLDNSAIKLDSTNIGKNVYLYKDEEQIKYTKSYQRGLKRLDRFDDGRIEWVDIDLHSDDYTEFINKFKSYPGTSSYIANNKNVFYVNNEEEYLNLVGTTTEENDAFANDVLDKTDQSGTVIKFWVWTFDEFTLTKRGGGTGTAKTKGYNRIVYDSRYEPRMQIDSSGSQQWPNPIITKELFTDIMLDPLTIDAFKVYDLEHRIGTYINLRSDSSVTYELPYNKTGFYKVSTVNDDIEFVSSDDSYKVEVDSLNDIDYLNEEHLGCRVYLRSDMVGHPCLGTIYMDYSAGLDDFYKLEKKFDINDSIENRSFVSPNYHPSEGVDAYFALIKDSDELVNLINNKNHVYFIGVSDFTLDSTSYLKGHIYGVSPEGLIKEFTTSNNDVKEFCSLFSTILPSFGNNSEEKYQFLYIESEKDYNYNTPSGYMKLRSRYDDFRGRYLVIQNGWEYKSGWYEVKNTGTTESPKYEWVRVENLIVSNGHTMEIVYDTENSRWGYKSDGSSTITPF